MINSVLNNTRYRQFLPHNFYVTKDIPLDSRYLINAISTVDTELPAAIRYPGLLFYSSTEETFYYIDKTSTIIPLTNLSTQYSLNTIEVLEASYSQLNTILNLVVLKEHRILTIANLKVSFIYNIDTLSWEYFAGNYNVSTDEIFGTIPANLKTVGKLVLSNGVRKIIKSDKTLSTELILSVSVPNSENLENNRYYLINGILHYSISGSIYPLNTKTLVLDTTLNKGKNLITHNFNSNHILCYLRIYNVANPDIESDNVLVPAYRINNANSIEIYSEFSGLNTIVFLTSQK